MIQNKLYLFYAGFLLLTACAKNPGTSLAAPDTEITIPNSVQQIIDDYSLPHEGFPHGVPAYYDWYAAPRTGWGNTPFSEWHAMTAWGQLYEDAKGNPATNTRVQIKDIYAWYLSKKDLNWHLWQFAKLPDGSAFAEDFGGNYSKPADIRNESSGGISVTAGDGFNFHYWPSSGRALIADNSDIKGVFTTCKTRLIINDIHQPDDRATARYLLGMGADYWRDQTAGWSADWSNNGDIGIGRFNYVTIDWRSVNMTTITSEELLQYPPPLN